MEHGLNTDQIRVSSVFHPWLTPFLAAHANAPPMASELTTCHTLPARRRGPESSGLSFGRN